MSYFVVGKEANIERPCAAAGGGAVGDQRQDTISNRGWVIANLGQLHILLVTNID